MRNIFRSLFTGIKTAVERVLSRSHDAKWKKWRMRLEDDLEGKIILSNMFYDVVNNRLPKRVIKAFLRDISAAWSGRRPIEDAKQLVNNIIQDKQDDYLCSGEVPSNLDVQCSRIMTMADLVTWNIDTNNFGWGGIPCFVPEEWIQELLERDNLDGITTGFLENELGFAWVTQADSVCKMRDTLDPTDFPHIVRNSLGLDSIGNGKQIVEILYPRHTFSNGGLHGPTFLEGNPNPYYRSKRQDDGWGMTIDLSSNEDGFPEAVHKGISPKKGFKLQQIGNVLLDPPKISTQMLLTKHPTPWTIASLQVFCDHVE